MVIRYRVNAGETGWDEIESAVSLAAEAALDVVHELAPNGLERVDAERRARHGLGGHVALGRVALRENGEQDVVLRPDAQLRRQVTAGLVHVRRLDQIVVAPVLAVALNRHLQSNKINQFFQLLRTRIAQLLAWATP